MNLTTEQKAAIDYPHNAVITACPGSGKTTILIYKIKSLLTHCKNYQGIIAISYTNKASDELKKRCQSLIFDTKESFFGTIDKFYLKEIIIPFLKQIWGTPTSLISTFKYSDLSVDNKELVNIYFPLDNIDFTLLNDNLNNLVKLFKSGIIVLETIPILAFIVLCNSESCKRYIKAKYKGIFIDEYQDSGVVQHRIFLKLAEIGLISIAVGDLEQSIYGYSGRSPESLKKLILEPRFKHLTITINHRCHPSISNYANRLMRPDCALLETNEQRVFRKKINGNQTEIARWIGVNLDEIKKHYAINKNRDVAILVRSNLCASIIASNVNYPNRAYFDDLLSKLDGVTTDLIKNLLSYRYENNTAQSIIDSFYKNISNKMIITSLRRKIKEVRVCDDDQLIIKIKDVVFLLIDKDISVSHVDAINEVINNVEIRNNYKKSSDNEIQILTLHKSKGLEFDFVFHIDLYDWILPRRAFIKGSYDIVFENEEQCLNLHYVGITRAKKGIVLITSTKRLNSDLEEKNGNPSQFLERQGLAELYLQL
ncbi:TPA: ATP-dependent helicase [Yersinia enterocolitica]|nr:ATP-dependent helicase [Yersinia enterocolitica]HDM9019124.1 ATP-dependent helicase [Yersinia enterocolitica]HDU2642560.1 ATP-dependent helicase [Yersinia enterocolitica]HDW8054397.1 ATP-dependent helicase [Yersinia enterocolitica]HEF7251191.1 ATP-dependent helicase [Yersinia enterocolitica]